MLSADMTWYPALTLNIHILFGAKFQANIHDQQCWGSFFPGCEDLSISKPGEGGVDQALLFISTAKFIPPNLHLELHFFFPDHFSKREPSREQMQCKSNKGRKELKTLCSPCSTSINLLALFSFLPSFFSLTYLFIYFFSLSLSLASQARSPVLWSNP